MKCMLDQIDVADVYMYLPPSRHPRKQFAAFDTAQSASAYSWTLI